MDLESFVKRGQAAQRAVDAELAKHGGSQAAARPACGPCNLGDHDECCAPAVPCACGSASHGMPKKGAYLNHSQNCLDRAEKFVRIESHLEKRAEDTDCACGCHRREVARDA